MDEATLSHLTGRWTTALARALSVLIVLAASVGTGGCAPRWVHTYVAAERLAKPAEKPILVLYRDHLDIESSEAQEALAQPGVVPLLKNYVLCSLVSVYDPNRRYMFQFGVAAPPALVIVHPDGTYHALADGLTPERIKSFLADSKPPGGRPQVDIQVTRLADYLVRAEGSYEKALDKARRQNRKLLIVYKWWLDGNSTKMISHRMTRPEVSSRCTETINCVLDWDYMPNRSHVAKYGVTKFPALIVVHQDGSYHACEGVGNVEEIVRFLSMALAGEGERAYLEAGRPCGWNWNAYHSLACARATRTGRGLFVFYHSLVEDDSERMMRLLNTETVSAMFSDTVNCSLDWSDARNRQVMGKYGVERTPAFVAQRPDGTYLVRKGIQTAGSLRELRDFLAGG